VRRVRTLWRGGGEAIGANGVMWTPRWQVVSQVHWGRRGGEGGGVGRCGRLLLVGGVWAWVALLVERDVVRHVRLGDLLVGEQRVAWSKLRVSGH